jgi:hypothetical protein
MGHADIKTTMIYVDVAKPHIQEQVEKLNRIPVPPPPDCNLTSILMKPSGTNTLTSCYK